MTPEGATAETPDFDAETMPHEDFLPENDGSQFNSPVFPTAEMDPDMEEFRARMRMFNMRLTTSRKVDSIKP